tara:strand:+ start:393 stop:1094 length:702 start_codon:yes stop_codon:yes gene_type:complete
MKKRVLAIIPARHGSKRIKNKNIKIFFGKPIIYYAIKNAIKSNIFNDIIVSTDSKKIAKISNKFGAKTPFLRSKKLSNDNTNTISVIIDAIHQMEKIGKKYDFVCCIYPANPFLNPKNLIKAFNIIKNEKNIDYVLTGVAYQHPIERSFKIKNNKIVSLQIKKINSRTQDLHDSFHDGAQFYLGKTNKWKSKKPIISKKSKIIVLDQLNSQDIDYPSDFEMAKIKFKNLNLKL